MEWISLIKEYNNQKKYAIELALDYLVKYYSYQRKDAEQVLILFIKNHKRKLDNDYLVFNDGSFVLASLIHYLITLNGDLDIFFQWKANNETYQKFRYEADYDFIRKIAQPDLFENRYK